MRRLRWLARPLSVPWARWNVVLWSLDAEGPIGTLRALPFEWAACLRARLWLTRRAHVPHTLPIVMRREKTS